MNAGSNVTAALAAERRRYMLPPVVQRSVLPSSPR